MKKLFKQLWAWITDANKVKPTTPYVDHKKGTYIYENKKIDKFDKLK